MKSHKGVTIDPTILRLTLEYIDQTLLDIQDRAEKTGKLDDELRKSKFILNFIKYLAQKELAQLGYEDEPFP